VADVVLHYRPAADCPDINALKPGECCIRKCGTASGQKWWNLWFYVRRDDDAALIDVAVPLNPYGDFFDGGPGGKHWGFKRLPSGVWAVTPSINVMSGAMGALPYPGAHPTSRASIWHHNVNVALVPEGEPWMR
jgi:hypothetical protein